MLGGYKGNATISYTGIRGLRRWAWTGRWRRLVREANALAQVRGRRTRAILREAAAPPLPHRLNAWVHTTTRGARRPFMDVFPSAIHPELVRERRLEQRVRDMGLDPRVPDRSLGRDFRMRNLKRVGDAADLYRGLRALYGAEFRDPTSDLRVVEFCLAIPDEQYLQRGRDRMLVRRAMAGLVPDAVLQRHTRGAQSPDWYERLTPARPRMRELIDRMDASDTVRACIDVPRLRRLVDDWPDAPRLEDQADHQMRLTTGLHTGAFLLWFEAHAGGSDA
jgi:asparagine synthase (glutamine-hydrolysing)